MGITTELRRRNFDLLAGQTVVAVGVGVVLPKPRGTSGIFKMWAAGITTFPDHRQRVQQAKPFGRAVDQVTR